MKEVFTTLFILVHFNYKKAIVLETDRSSYFSTGVVSLYNKEAILHPIGFFLKQHTLVDENNEIYNQKLGATVKNVEQWRPECKWSA